MSGRLNKLQALTAFTHVVEEGGFAAAAVRSKMSPSAVTKAIARLEDELGTKLVHRTTRNVALTEYGRVFYHRCAQIIADLDDAEARLKAASTAPQGTVRVAMPFAFGRYVVIPRLSEFREKYPSIILDVEFDDGVVDMIRGGFDLVVRVGDLPDSGLIRRVLLTTRAVTVASRAYIENWGEPCCPEELREHDCIIDGRTGPIWRFRVGDQMRQVEVSGRLRLGSDDALRDAVRGGLGIVHSTQWLLSRDIEEGTVLPILSDFETEEDTPISVLYSGKRNLPAKVVTFVDFLMRITADSTSYRAFNWFRRFSGRENRDADAAV